MKKLLHLVGCLHRCTGDAQSRRQQELNVVGLDTFNDYFSKFLKAAKCVTVKGHYSEGN